MARSDKVTPRYSPFVSFPPTSEEKLLKPGLGSVLYLAKALLPCPPPQILGTQVAVSWLILNYDDKCYVF